ncbi:sensor histidine kinase [Thermasporomyces composti]|uniref:histidine kinase n=1 Tax=Thermasporomyces composti TaxID=696763 RepID=A0A3D9V5K3_THECX|nr:histidine kinase [Thermasporomyces composti]REF37038.1 signal transduction histidine kinase [Thermasporomyces composti]
MPQRRVYEWLRRRPLIVDGAIVALLLVILLPETAAASADPGPAGTVLGVAQLVPLVWRRRHPVRVFTVVSLVCLAQVILLDVPLPANAGFLLALYAVSAYAHGRVRLAALAVGFLGAALGPLDWLAWSELFDHPEYFARFFVVLAAFVALTWTLGDLMRTRRAYVAELEERARRLEVERDQQARLARAAERARIARELHDVVAHSLSIVVAQADGGLYAGEKDPNAARSALATIGVTGRQALAEMRRLLGVLHSGGDAADLAPQPGLAQLPELVAQVRASGLPVELVLEEPKFEISSGAELVVFRIVQEALTNTIRHAGPGARARVEVTYGADTVRVCVSDDGRGAAATSDGQGRGIHGMRERVAVYGGTLSVGPRAGGGFQVVAELPLGENAATAGQSSGAGEASDGGG